MAKRTKYGVSIVSERTHKGKVYMSKLEMQYAKHLGLLQKAKGKDKVVFVSEQVPFPCVVNGKKICTYLLDFKVEYADGRIEYVDVKGMKTAIYNLKKKLVEALYSIKIKEVYKGDF
jgi:uncharacterized protein YlaN (UPF0358 family)